MALKKKSGLRAFHVNERLASALDITKKVLDGKSKFKIENVIISATSEYPGKRIVFSGVPKNNFSMFGDGFFEIHDSKGIAALVHVKDFGKPVIYVKGKENKPLGKEISEAFKKHADFLFSPKIKVHDELLSSKSYFEKIKSY